jgi:phage I-like protein
MISKVAYEKGHVELEFPAMLDSKKDKGRPNLAEEMPLRYFALIAGEPLVDETDLKVSTIQVFRTGKFKHPVYGQFTITPEDLSAMVANFKANRPKSPTELVVDYEHMSAMGSQVSPAAGWVKSLEVRGNALFATVEWTDKAAEMVKSREYRFISPEWHMHYRDKESGKDLGPTLMAIALTNRPFIEGMAPVMLSEGVTGQVVTDICENMPGDISAKAVPSDELLGQTPAKAKALVEDAGENMTQEVALEEKLRTMLGLGPDGDIVAAVKALMDKGSQTEQAKQAAEAKLAEVTTAKETAEASLLASNAKILAAEVDMDVSQAVKDNLLLPKQVPWAKAMRAKDPEGFKAFLAVAPKVGPDGRIVGREDGEGNVTLTETEVKIGEKMGVSKEALLTQKKADKASK